MSVHLCRWLSLCLLTPSPSRNQGPAAAQELTSAQHSGARQWLCCRCTGAALYPTQCSHLPVKRCTQNTALPVQGLYSITILLKFVSFVMKPGTLSVVFKQSSIPRRDILNEGKRNKMNSRTVWWLNHMAWRFFSFWLIIGLIHPLLQYLQIWPNTLGLTQRSVSKAVTYCISIIHCCSALQRE